MEQEEVGSAELLGQCLRWCLGARRPRALQVVATLEPSLGLLPPPPGGRGFWSHTCQLSYLLIKSASISASVKWGLSWHLCHGAELS